MRAISEIDVKIAPPVSHSMKSEIDWRVQQTVVYFGALLANLHPTSQFAEENADDLALARREGKGAVHCIVRTFTQSDQNVASSHMAD